MRENLIILLSLVLIFNLGGCQQRGTKTDKIVLRYVSYEYLPFQVTVHRAIVDGFNKSQNKIFVKFETAERVEKILTQIAGGDAPDVFLWFSAHVYDLVKKGVLIELTSYLESTSVNTGEYFTDLFNLLTVRLDTVGITFFGFYVSRVDYGCYGNKNMLQSKG